MSSTPYNIRTFEKIYKELSIYVPVDDDYEEEVCLVVCQIDSHGELFYYNDEPEKELDMYILKDGILEMNASQIMSELAEFCDRGPWDAPIQYLKAYIKEKLYVDMEIAYPE